VDSAIPDFTRAKLEIVLSESDLTSLRQNELPTHKLIRHFGGNNIQS
jgi:hypothetical protein